MTWSLKCDEYLEKSNQVFELPRKNPDLDGKTMTPSWLFDDWTWKTHDQISIKNIVKLKIFRKIIIVDIPRLFVAYRWRGHRITKIKITACVGKPRRGLRNPRSRPGKTMTKSRPRHGNSRSGPGYTPTVKYWSWLFPRPGHGKAMTNHGFSPTRFQKNRFFLRRNWLGRKTWSKTLPFQFFRQKTLFKARTRE